MNNTAPQSTKNNWHLFCKVIDNYGDIGVCWRLAQQLVGAHHKTVTLWVDNLHSFNAICPEVNPQQSWQQVCGVNVGHWSEPFETESFNKSELLNTADVVIEAFACELPSSVLDAMKAQAQQPVWINLEYLSAESWVEDFHTMPSPVHGMTKYFYFPGFTENTGGLLWQPELLALPELMQTKSAKQLLFKELDVKAEFVEQEILISLFAYENPQVQGLLEALSQSEVPISLLVPQGRISEEVSLWLQQPIALGESVTKGAVTVTALPFMSQPQYDRLLAACDINFVRGEESFVRAQMLGIPMLWHIYEQQENAHIIKLEAFLSRYLKQATIELAEQLQNTFLAWNQPIKESPDWLLLLKSLDKWKVHARSWQQQQKSVGDLATNLVKYTENTL